MLDCRRASELVSQSMDRKLGPIERVRLHLHMRICDMCRDFREQMTFLRSAARNHPLLRKDRDDEGD